MKRALIIGCTMVFTAATAMAQDFVSKYMQENKPGYGATLHQCQSQNDGRSSENRLPKGE